MMQHQHFSPNFIDYHLPDITKPVGQIFPSGCLQHSIFLLWQFCCVTHSFFLIVPSPLLFSCIWYLEEELKIIYVFTNDKELINNQSELLTNLWGVHIDIFFSLTNGWSDRQKRINSLVIRVVWLGYVNPALFY